jgi:hypothetical protein
MFFGLVTKESFLSFSAFVPSAASFLRVSIISVEVQLAQRVNWLDLYDI